MPPKIKYTRDEIISAACELVRQGGIEKATARAVAKALDSSPKVIFGAFDGMDDLKDGVIAMAGELYGEYVRNEMATNRFPPYKSMGMAYIRFAAEEKELFKLLFMRDRMGDFAPKHEGELEPVIDVIMNATGLDEETARLFHLELWITVHGIASMVATGYMEFDWELISRVLTDSYQGALHCIKEKNNDSNKNL
ncbi:MAG: TetR/AcrR family transcriptional regulator [Clostridia bacterium]|nr:TetR/AcrR family transcriptional regulator [Clostridia bacterium]